MTDVHCVLVIWWFVSAHKWFKGPKVNLEHLMLDREDGIPSLQGEEVKTEGSESGDSVGVSSPGSSPVDQKLPIKE